MAHSPGHHHGHHIIPKSVLIGVFAGLVVLTVITVLAAQIDIGILNVPLALAIAISKATLVVLFFMALKYDQPVNSLVFGVGGIFVVVFLGFTLLDTAFRGDLDNVDAQTIQELERQEEALRAREPDPAAAGIVVTDTTAAADSLTADTTGAADVAEADTAGTAAPVAVDTAAVEME